VHPSRRTLEEIAARLGKDDDGKDVDVSDFYREHRQTRYEDVAPHAPAVATIDSGGSFDAVAHAERLEALWHLSPLNRLAVYQGVQEFRSHFVSFFETCYAGLGGKGRVASAERCCRVLTALRHWLLLLGVPESARVPLAGKLVAVAERAGDAGGRIEAWNFLGHCLFGGPGQSRPKGEAFARALGAWQRARDLAKGVDLDVDYARAVGHVGRLRVSCNVDPEVGLKELGEAARLAEVLHDKEWQGIWVGNQGRRHYHTRSLQAALDCRLEERKLRGFSDPQKFDARRLDPVSAAHEDLNNLKALAETYRAMKRPDLAAACERQREKVAGLVGDGPHRLDAGRLLERLVRDLD
jgi:hypothetical protein